MYGFVPNVYWCSVEDDEDWFNRQTKELHCSVSEFLVLFPVGTGVLLKTLKTYEYYADQ